MTPKGRFSLTLGANFNEKRPFGVLFESFMSFVRPFCVLCTSFSFSSVARPFWRSVLFVNPFGGAFFGCRRRFLAAAGAFVSSPFKELKKEECPDSRFDVSRRRESTRGKKSTKYRPNPLAVARVMAFLR